MRFQFDCDTLIARGIPSGRCKVACARKSPGLAAVSMAANASLNQTEPPPLISVVIPSFNTASLLKDCLQSLAAERAACTLEVIVVDNDSVDGSGEMVAGAFPWVRLIRLERNLGYSGGVNRGLRMVQGDLIVILNADSLVHEKALATLYRALLANPSAGAGCPRCLNPDGTLQANGFRFFTLMDFVRQCLGFYPHDHRREHDGSCPVDTPSGACLCLTRRGLTALGEMDERLELYLEEQDIGRRLTACGLSSHYIAEAVITHLGAASSVQLDQWERFTSIHRTRAHFLRKHYGRWQAALIGGFTAVAMSKRVLISLWRWVSRACGGQATAHVLRIHAAALRNYYVVRTAL